MDNVKFVTVKKVVPPATGDETQEKVENKVIREGLDKLIADLKAQGYLTVEKEPIDNYTVVTLKVSVPGLTTQVKELNVVPKDK